MTHPEKRARELVEKFKPFVESIEGFFDPHYDEEEEFKNAKQCALIDIQNTIDMLRRIFNRLGGPKALADEIFEMESIKSEILKMKE